MAAFVGCQQAQAATISAVPETQPFGPNDWIVIHVKISGYNGGPLLWTARHPDNSTAGGVLDQVKPDGTVTQEIVRDAFDNYFGRWTMTYDYDKTNQTINFTVSPIVLTVSTDKTTYYEPDVMQVNITTSYYNPVASRAEFFRLNFIDPDGNVITDIPTIEIRAAQPSIIYDFHMGGIANYHPPGAYKLRVKYYNTVREVPFLVGRYREFMSITSSTDRDHYIVGDPVKLDMLFTHVSQSEGTLKITDPAGNVTTRQFQVFSVRTPLVLTGLTQVPGNYSYTIQYGGATDSGSFSVVPNPHPVPNITFQIFPDKLYYRPGEIMHVKAYASQAAAGSVDLWAVDPHGVEYPRTAIPVTSTDAILLHKIGSNYTTGRWEIYADYGGIVRAAPFYVQGPPVSEAEVLSPVQYSMPSFASEFGSSTPLSSPTGIAVGPDNNVYVVDSGDGQVKKFDPAGRLLLSWGTVGSGDGQLLHPGGIAVGDRYVYVADTGNARIEMFDKQGRFIYSWGSYGSGLGLFHTPVGLVKESSGKLLVADSGLGTVQVFNSQYQYSGEIRSPRTEGLGFAGLGGIASGPGGNFYATSTDDKVLEFSSIGRFENFVGSGGTEDGRFDGPAGIAADSMGDFYVADAGNHRIQKFDRYGNFLLSWGGAGTGPGRFGEPSGLAIDSLGNIYVTDKENNDIQKFSLYGSHNRIIVPDRITERVAGWSQGELHRNDFLLALKFMAGQGVINTGGTAPAAQPRVPAWLKHVAAWWEEGRIDDRSFYSDIQFLISNGMLSL